MTDYRDRDGQWFSESFQSLVNQRVLVNREIDRLIKKDKQIKRVKTTVILKSCVAR